MVGGQSVRERVVFNVRVASFAMSRAGNALTLHRSGGASTALDAMSVQDARGPEEHERRRRCTHP